MSEKIIERLKKISLFKDFKNDEKSLSLFSSIMQTKNYAKGEYIIREGDVGSEMFILDKGSVHIDRRTLEKDSYRIVTLSSDMNVFFGEQALTDSDKRSATVIAAEDCELFVVSQKDFISFGDTYPALGLGVTREISKKNFCLFKKS